MHVVVDSSIRGEIDGRFASIPSLHVALTVRSSFVFCRTPPRSSPGRGEGGTKK